MSDNRAVVSTAALKTGILAIEKEFGKGAIRQIGDKEVITCDVIPTKLLGLDRILGIGGFARGRQTELYGIESIGKSSICFHALAEAQKVGEIAIIDSEHAIDLTYAKNIGVDINKLWISQPECGEVALGVLENLVSTGEFSMIVVDSVAALTPRAEIEGEMGQSHMGLQARLMSQAMRKLTAIIAQKNTAVLWTNQLRKNLGGYGNPNVTTGGNSLKYYASVRIELTKGDAITVSEGEDPTAVKVKVKVVKNKLASPFRICELTNTFGFGFSKEASTLEEAVNADIVNKAGSWYSYKDIKLGQGAENVIAKFKNDLDLYNKIHTETYDTLFKIPAAAIAKVEEIPVLKNRTKPEAIEESKEK